MKHLKQTNFDNEQETASSNNNGNTITDSDGGSNKKTPSTKKSKGRRDGDRCLSPGQRMMKQRGVSDGPMVACTYRLPDEQSTTGEQLVNICT
jgi:hypothetical protein